MKRFILTSDGAILGLFVLAVAVAANLFILFLSVLFAIWMCFSGAAFCILSKAWCSASIAA